MCFKYLKAISKNNHNICYMVIKYPKKDINSVWKCFPSSFLPFSHVKYHVVNKPYKIRFLYVKVLCTKLDTPTTFE